ncbi:DUF3772 domain-containing protein [Stenotrophomonas sp. HITSZ_GD]|uniref:DUF3772 domain-containing protein n=1 Tax=Stenotrophomonas sp. HITSZ_GD TaxID=3037248 RepID=UPI00240E521F|nr:DUF3772 domain-containing protein [Stenotrophomonas sp. HITSZ_GD]MDG2526164.1 DUF3772 domain-containing protein [Stenotrophomonas sp. HITSZ_GD]
MRLFWRTWRAPTVRCRTIRGPRRRAPSASLVYPPRKFPALSAWLCRFWLACCLGLLTGAAWAQAQPDTSLADAQKVLDGAEDRLAEVNKQLPATEAVEDFIRLNEQLASVQRDTQSAAQALDAPLADVKARLDQLGPVPTGTRESPDIASQRRELTARQAKLDDARKRAELLSLDASQAAANLERARSQKFNQSLSTRTASPLSPALWRNLGKASPNDADALRGVASGAWTGLRSALAREGSGALIGSLAIALLLAFPVRIVLRRLGRRLVTSRGPGGRLRRSALAVWLLLVGTLSIGLAASALIGTLQSIGAVPDDLLPLAENFVRASFFAAFISALSGALMSRGQASWRLFKLDDATARRLLWHCHAAAWLVWLHYLAIEILKVAGTSDALTQAVDALSALLYVALILSALAGLTRSLRRTEHDPAADAAGASTEDDPKAVTSTAKAPPRALSTRGGGVVALARMLGYCAVLLALLATLVGYLNIAVFITRQIVWVALIWGAIALMLAFIDDLCTWLVRPENRLSRALVGIGVRPSLLAQAGALVSAGLRVCVLVSGVAALLMPYGSNLSLFGNLFSALSTGLKLGNVRFAPAEIFGALATLAIGWTLLQGAQQWLNKTYLPKTDLDVGTRASVSAVVRYVGIVVVILWALAALGITAANLALVASALSVGIGFGLQAITQNFISGLILMAERPVRVGDWIRLGDQEGDVKRINVRATEIQIGDRSTLIVPNSELITKSVRNMTLSNPLGRVQLQFAVPIGTDMARVRELLLTLYAAHPKVLSTPAPSVFIDGIANGQANFNSFLYVGSPRDAYGVRSELFFGLLARMAEEGIALNSPQDIRVVAAPGQPTARPDEDAAQSPG